MAILITGSTGYIGSKLTAQLARQGNAIHLLCRTIPALPGSEKANIKIFKGDITNPESLKPALENVDQVYHLAAYARLWAKDASVFQTLNVKGTENVLAAAKAAGVLKVVYTSTAGVIGPSKDKPMTETDPRITGFFNLYESTKSEAEAVALDYAKQGLAVCILNPSRIYGPGYDTGSNPVTKIVELYMKGKWKVIPGNGNDIGSYPFIDDVVDGHTRAMEKGRSGERYILGGVNATFNDLMAIIKKYSGVEKQLRHVPFFVLNALSRIMLWNANITGKYPMITPDWVAKYKYHWALDSSKAVNELGYKIRPLEEGIKETVEWIKQNRQ
ncbi:NAD-dependent epimerase/dehydratase family protein [Agriterribacter sp.]|uniref:NAD-dependent epimerase/dehydratase family protein n=1 Tax=Agriterribacter sp. TaxID=2821509 RepID=UPI002C8E6A7F|nr:NAD-dependent epimerase/dehydratase family protein [Agriterribacter sp.]HTN07395.1 NAD-dependent epimerase/dehydratase family protein [Agriterribacter sp.]